MSNDPGAREILWRQYQQNVDLYKFYLDIVVKLNIFHYAVTGAILSFFFTRSEISDAKYSVLLPLVMSCAFAVLFVYGAVLNRITRAEQFAIRDDLGLSAAPDFGVLSVILYIFAFVFLLTAGACGLILWRY